MAGRSLSALLLACICGCAFGKPSLDAGAVRPSGGPSAEVTVRVTWKDAPLSGVRVEWTTGIAEDGGEVAASETTDTDGIAVFSLPPGRWFLRANWRVDGDFARKHRPGDRFAFFGGNPVYLAAGPPRDYFIGLAEVAGPPPGPDPPPEEGSGVSGTVLAEGSPLADARVFAYLRTETAFRDMGFAASAATGPDGSFFLDIPPGRYYLVARKRASGAIAGPLRKGDAFGYFPSNPVEVGEGVPVRVTIPVTTLRMRNIPAYSAESEASGFIEGRILGVDGKPRPGVYAALYDNPDLLNRPVFISDVTGEDGRYRLPVPVPGVYYLGARSGYGGSPAPGDLYGRYEGNAGHTVTVREGARLPGIDLVVDEVR